LLSAVQDALATAIEALDDGGSPALENLFEELADIDQAEAFQSAL
jgi:hypothetical protein